MDPITYWAISCSRVGRGSVYDNRSGSLTGVSCVAGAGTAEPASISIAARDFPLSPMAVTSFSRLALGITFAVAISPLSIIIRGGFSSAKSSGDFSMAAGVPEDPDATTVSSISIIRFAVAVNSGTSWAARGRVLVLTLEGLGVLIRLNRSISYIGIVRI
ncbi:hypothetical protein Tco_0285020 [Tanacetum coccineum]